MIQRPRPAKAVPAVASAAAWARLISRVAALAGCASLAAGVAEAQTASTQPTTTRDRQPASASAPEATAYPLSILRWSEDWSYLRTRPQEALSPYEQLKFMPLDAAGASYLSFGAELRARIDGYDEPLYGVGRAGADDFASRTFRALAHADLHLGPHLRGFAQLGVFGESGREPNARPPDESGIDLHQGFFDLSAPPGALFDGAAVSLRLGRQQLAYGSGRLVAVRDATNIQRAFDGANLTLASPGLVTMDAFIARPVAPRRGAFDDKGANTEAAWGLYSTWRTAAVLSWPFDADLYYVGRERDRITFAQGTAREDRHTFGTRLFGRMGVFDYNLEGAVQLGSFGGADIVAFGGAFDGGYTALNLPLAPRFGMKVDVASGDSDPRDGRLGTFDALYPALDYFSSAAVYAPTNGIDVQPSLRLNWTRSFWTQAGVNLFWRLETTDAFYAASGEPIVRPGQSDRHFATALVNLDAAWRINPFTEIKGAVVYGVAGAAVRDVGGQDQLFSLLQIVLRF